MDEIAVTTVNYKGDIFDLFHARRDPGMGPGWYVFGRNPSYGDHYIMLCARPNVTPRRHPHYNVQVRRGWTTKREAETVAARLAATCL